MPYKQKNRWYTYFYDHNGKRVRRVIHIEGKDPSDITRKEAEQVENILKGKVYTGEKLISLSKSVSFDSLIDMYRQWCNGNHKNPERDEIYCKHLLSFFNGYKAEKVTEFAIEKYRSNRRKEGISNNTLNKEIKALKQMYSLAFRWNKIESNPVKDIKLLKEKIKEKRVIDDSEFRNLHNSASEHFKPILLFAFYTGARRGEIRSLKWKNVNFHRSTVTFVDTKNNEDRTLPLNTTLRDILLKLKEVSVCGNVFTFEGKPYLNEKAWTRAWRTALRNSGIDYCTFHSLRHTFISNLIVKYGIDIQTVMSLSGHKDINTLKRYIHTNENARRNAVELLENSINSEILANHPANSDVFEVANLSDKRL